MSTAGVRVAAAGQRPRRQHRLADQDHPVGALVIEDSGVDRGVHEGRPGLPAKELVFVADLAVGVAQAECDAVGGEEIAFEVSEILLRRPPRAVVALTHIELECSDLLAHGGCPLIEGFRGRGIFFNQC